MVKQKYQFYFEPADMRKLKIKLAEFGFEGQNSLSRFLTRVIEDSLIFVSGSVKIEVKENGS